MGNTRTTGTEQYYTPPAVAEELTAVMERLVPRSSERTWIEPAAGTGSFLRAMDAKGWEWRAWDIEPKAPGVVRANFLELDVEVLRRELDGAACLTNPPFGRNHALSVPFFNTAAQFCEYIGFIVPRSWRKWSITNRLDPQMHLIWDSDLEVGYLDEDGEPLSSKKVLRTVFQVWERRAEAREKIVVEDRGYVKKTTPERADVSLTVFGYGCGSAKTEFPRVPNTTQMFLEASPEVVRALQEIDFSEFSERVAYVEALSLPEIRFSLNRYFDAKGDLSGAQKAA